MAYLTPVVALVMANLFKDRLSGGGDQISEEQVVPLADPTHLA
jgi:hypothetical protein